MSANLLHGNYRRARGVLPHRQVVFQFSLRTVFALTRFTLSAALKHHPPKNTSANSLPTSNQNRHTLSSFRAAAALTKTYTHNKLALKLNKSLPVLLRSPNISTAQSNAKPEHRNIISHTTQPIAPQQPTNHKPSRPNTLRVASRVSTTTNHINIYSEFHRRGVFQLFTCKCLMGWHLPALRFTIMI